MKEECELKIGVVKRITVHEFHPDGVVQIKFDEPKHAEDCIKVGLFEAAHEWSFFQ